MNNYGVIDLGSNSIRLCVYEVDEEKLANKQGKFFRSLLNNKSVAGLSAYVVDGYFTDQGIAVAIDVLKGHNKRLKYFECKQTHVFATAVLRNCINSSQAIAAIEQKSGLSITLLSESEEARLGFIGATLEKPIENGILVDIGGGSTEVTRIRKTKGIAFSSIKQGALSSFAGQVKAIVPTEKEMKKITTSFAQQLDTLDELALSSSETVYGIGGSLRALSKAYAKVFDLSERSLEFSREEIDSLIQAYLDNPNTFSHAVLKAAPDRVHTLIPGCLIIQEIMKRCDAHTLSLRKKGVREGYLLEYVLLANGNHL